MDFLEYRDGELYCDDARVADVIAQVGTPAYLYSRNAVLARLRELTEAFAEVSPLICFSVKSNSNLSICKTLAEGGSGFDVVSGGELFRVLKAGGDPANVVYAGVAKTSSEIEYALKNRIFMFNVESESELANIDRIAGRLGGPARVALRVNPDVDAKTHAKTTTGKKENKFGIGMAAAGDLLRSRGRFPNLSISGIHLHLGSPIMTPEPYSLGLKKMLEVWPQWKSDDPDFEYINIGGGYCISYTGEPVVGPSDYAQTAVPLIKELGCKLIIEPGRFIVGNSGILITRIIYRKKTDDGKKFLLCDGAMTDLIRPALYDAYHRIWPVSAAMPFPAVETADDKPTMVEGMELTDVVGPVCESSDYFGKDRVLPRTAEGDLLAVFSAGAYGFAMSSNYNSRPRACEVMISGGDFTIVRRRETYDDLVDAELPCV